MLVKIKLLLSIALLLVNVSDTQATKLYDFNQNIVREINDITLKQSPYLKQACFLNDATLFSNEIKDRTQIFIQRESAFRQQCNIAQGTNIAQYCLYKVKKGDKYQVIDNFDRRPCKGLFYLSGNTPVSISTATSSREANVVDVQKVSFEKGFLEIKQRLQPLLLTVDHTLSCFSNLERYVHNQTLSTQSLVDIACSQKKTLESLKNQQKDVIIELNKIAAQQQTLIESLDPLFTIHSQVCQFTKGIIGELITSLEENDFEFHGIKDVRNNANLKVFIDHIQSKLSEKNFDSLFNSKHINLGCSEPLLIYDIKDEFKQNNIIKSISSDKNHEEIESIILHLHSTKTPCKSCLVDCMAHLQDEKGIIHKFFDNIRTSLKNQKLPIYFMISYHDNYYDDNGYPFAIPVQQEWQRFTDSLIVFNAQIFDQNLMKQKKAIIIEERLNLARKLLLDKVDKITIMKCLELNEDDVAPLYSV